MKLVFNDAVTQDQVCFTGPSLRGNHFPILAELRPSCALCLRGSCTLEKIKEDRDEEGSVQFPG